MSDPLTNPTPLPTPGQTPNWGRQLLAGIKDRTDPLRQLVTQGRLAPDVLSATIATEVEAKAGNVPMFGTQAEALAWEADHPGQVALWFDAGYQEVTPAGPTWTDNPLGGGTWSTPAEPGVTYTPASGTADPGQVVTVVATARPGYALIGTREWTHTFPMSTGTLFTDFTEDIIGELPDGWTPRWVVPATMGWTVIEHPAATGGQALEHRATTNERRILTWDALEPLNATDVEVVFKWRTGTAANGPRALVRAGGDSATDGTGYHGAIRNASEQAMGMLLAGPSGSFFTGSPISVVINTWYITRFRVEGNQLRAKTWLASEPEPADWILTATDSTYTTEGRVGLYCFGSGVQLIDWYGVAVNGETAPKGA